jgi:hypothetical protein
VRYPESCHNNLALNMRETPEQKWSRVQEKIQEAILTSYPNPNRDGCLDGDGLADLARRAAELGTLEGDDGWEHVTHCSPCYKEYLAARDQVRKSKAGSSNAAKK